MSDIMAANLIKKRNKKPPFGQSLAKGRIKFRGTTFVPHSFKPAALI